jgi:hypothetical protein
VFDEVNVDEHPAPADLRAGNLPGPCFLLQGHRMDVQEGSGSLQIERVDEIEDVRPVGLVV